MQSVALQYLINYYKFETKVVVLVGGISQIKQERQLKKQQEIKVPTPGRLRIRIKS